MFIKIIHHGLFLSKKSFEFTPVNLSLQTESISSSYTPNFNQDLSLEIPDIKRQPSGPHDAIPKVMSFPQNFVVSNTKNWYIPLRLPQTLHELPTKHYKYLPKFGREYEDLMVEKHLQSFEYFLDLFEIEHDDVCMRAFSQSLQGNVRKWFRHLQPRSITTWEEFSHTFLGFWGERRSLDQILSEFYSMKKHEGETMSSFNRRFASFYYNMSKEFQPLKGVMKLHYAFVFPLDLSLFF